MTNETIKAIMNTTFSGLSFFCRDLHLENKLMAQYQTGQILLEKGFTDMSAAIGGQEQNFRYLIATSNWRDLSEISPNAAWEHAMIQAGAYYKVLDIQNTGTKTQVLLLNIPKEGIELFQSSQNEIETQIIAKGKEIFDHFLNSTPKAALQSKEWLERTSFPLGMSDEGAFFKD